MNARQESWNNFRKAVLRSHQLICSSMEQTSTAPREELERSQRIQTLRLLILLSAGTRGLIDIPDWRKSPRPFQLNIIKWVLENPPYMRRAFAYSDLFEPAKQPYLWRLRPSEEALKSAIEILMETNPVSWEPTWVGDIYPYLLPADQRKEAGAYYTPWAVVYFIVDKALAHVCYHKPEQQEKPKDEQEILSVKVLDPAMGGGRFVIASVAYLANAYAKSRGEQMGLSHLRKVAGNVYGVDSDPLTVDVARFCLWLFLGGPEKPWDFLRNHFQCGDSLIGASLEDIDKFPASIESSDQLTLFKPDTPKREVPSLWSVMEGGRLIGRIETLANLWTCALLEEEGVLDELSTARLTIVHASDEKWAELENKPAVQKARKLAKELGFFHWELRFPEVFQLSAKEKRGFDAVVGNPPYRKERGGGTNLPLRSSPLWRRWGEGKMDLLALFIHRGLDLLNNDGRLGFITSNYWLKAEGASRLRNRLVNDERLLMYVDLAEYPIFEGLTGRHGIIVAGRGKRHPTSCKVLRLKSEVCADSPDIEELFSDVERYFVEEVFFDQRELMDEGGNFNLCDRVAEIVSKKMEERGLPLAHLAITSQGVVENPPMLTEKMISALREKSPSLVEEEGYEAGEAVFLLPREHHLISALSDEEMAFLKPYYRAGSIERYYLPESPDGYLIYLTPSNCPDIYRYPWLREHLERYRVFTEERREVKEGRIKWWHLHWPREEAFFEGEHLLLPQMCETPRVARAVGEAYVGMSVQVIVPQEVSGGFLTAVLNSKAVAFYLTQGGRAKERGAGLDITLQALRNIPIPRLGGKRASDHKKVEELMKMFRSWMSSFKSDKQ